MFQTIFLKKIYLLIFVKYIYCVYTHQQQNEYLKKIRKQNTLYVHPYLFDISA